MKRIAIVFGLALALSGCVTAEQQAARNDDKCKSYGAKPGTDAYLQCRLALDKMNSDQRAALLTSRPRGPTTCNTYGGTTTCY